MNDYERIGLIHELLYQARIKLGAALAASQGLQDVPSGIEGLWQLSKQVEQAWREYYRTIPDEDGESINDLVEGDE